MASHGQTQKDMILRCLQNRPTEELTAYRIAYLIGKPSSSISSLLVRMRKAGDVIAKQGVWDRVWRYQHKDTV